MQKNLALVLSFVIIVILLASCSSVDYTPDNISKFNKGDDIAKTYEVFNNDPYYEFDLSIEIISKPVKVLLFKKYIHQHVFDFWMFAYQDNSLIFWGTIDDFKRSDNERIRLIGIKAAAQIKTIL